MMLLWTFQTMKERQLFWTAFCMLSLLENHVSAIDTTSANVSQSTPTTMKPSSITKTPTGDPPGTTGTAASVTHATADSTSKNLTTKMNSSSPAASTTALSLKDATVQTSPTQWSTSHVSKGGMTEAVTTTKTRTSVPTVHTKPEFSTSLNTISAVGSHMMVTCRNIKELTSMKVICLELNRTATCEQFMEEKKEHLGKVVCATNDTCHIKLAKSDVNNKCILLTGVGDKGIDALDGVLEEKRHDLQKAGIKPHKHEDIENHKDYSRKTLIALVTTGLLLAFLGLAGYHLMKRRSWSPMGERLGEDPYYTENGSHGNPAISVASHEQSDLQDKPNLNGGAQENGTGQPTSKNGHSTRPQVVADTEL